MSTTRRPTHKVFYHPIELPYHRYLNYLTEELHIFKKEDLLYNKNIRDTVNLCLSDLNIHVSPIKLYQSKNVKFVKYSINKLLPELNAVDIYVGINYMMRKDEMDVINITYNYTDDINPKYLPLAISNKPGYYNKISIIAEISPDVLNEEKYQNILISSIHHELIHVLHDIKQTNLSIKAGDAYYYINAILQAAYYNFNFIDKDILVQMYRNRHLVNPILIFAACVYYCDKSEILAWHETIYNEYKEILSNASNSIFYKENKLKYRDSKNLYKSSSYQIYAILLYFLKIYKTDILNIFNTNDIKYNVTLENILKQYLGNNTIKNKINVWIKLAIKFLNNAQTIYSDLYQKTFKH